MRKLLLLPLVMYGMGSQGQDSLTAGYINNIVEKIEANLQSFIMEKKDTLIYEPDDSLKRGPYLSVRTEYYFNPVTDHMEKIVERTRFRTLVTEITVYYLLGQPIRFTSAQFDGSRLAMDFDVFYMNGNAVYFIKRKGKKGKPDGDEFLKWCYDLLHSYETELAIGNRK
jgi:hypothetical protein